MSDITSRMRVKVTLEFDTGSNYGGEWKFEDAYKDAKRACDNRLAELVAKNPWLRVVQIDSIASHVVEQKS